MLQDQSVSRNHAVIETTPAGVRLLDTHSANGVLVDRKRVSDILLTDGLQFEIGDTVFQFVAPPPEPEPAPAREFVISIVGSPDPAAIGRDFTVTGVASIGRGEECSVPLKDHSASRRHATVTPTDGGFRVADNASANGVWLDDRRISDAVLTDGQRFRVGDTFLECHAKVAGAVSDETVVMANLDQLMAKVAARQLSEAGEAVAVSGARGVLLDDPGYVYFVASGKVEIHTVGVKDGHPSGPRQHFITVLEGNLFFGMDLRYAGESGFVVSGKGDTGVRRIARDRVAALGADASVSAEIVKLIDRWVTALSRRLVEDIRVRPTADVSIEVGKPATLASEQRLSAAGGVAWIDTAPDTLLYIGLADLPGSETGGPSLFPVTGQTWIEAAGEPAGPLTITSRSTSQVLADAAAMWQGLAAFHRALCECEFINKRLALLDEVVRIDDRWRQSDAAKGAALEEIEAVMGTASSHGEMAAVGAVAPLLEACRLVAAPLGLKVAPAAESRIPRTFNEQVLAIAAASRFRVRQVAFRGDWWRHDQGPLLAVLAEDRKSVV